MTTGTAGESRVDTRPLSGGVFLVSLGVLVLQIALTRIFSFFNFYTWTGLRSHLHAVDGTAHSRCDARVRHHPGRRR
ncbi:MAG: hypothetical protein ABIR79_15950 [Candidatus Binatia bacterium]